MSQQGLGPHGEPPGAPDLLNLTPSQLAMARGARLRVALILSVQNEWASLFTDGLGSTLAYCGVELDRRGHGAFEGWQKQLEVIDTVLADPPHAIISLPITNANVTAAHERITSAGVRLVLVENYASGLLPGRDYATLVSTDNYQVGAMLAEGLAARLPYGARVANVSETLNSPALDQRDIAFVTWIRTHRPDLVHSTRRLGLPFDSDDLMVDMLRTAPAVDGISVSLEWRSQNLLRALAATGQQALMATTDLSDRTAQALVDGSTLAFVAAVQPFQLGEAAAKAAVLSMLGAPLPGWIAIPPTGVNRANLPEAFERINRRPLPADLRMRLDDLHAPPTG